MARKRMVAPEFFIHGALYDLEEATRLPVRLAFAGLWCQADRAGRFVWKPRELKLAILPYDPIDFRAVLDALEGAGFLRRYVVDGKEYGWIPTFTSHQTFHKNEAPSKLPPHPDAALCDGGADDGAEHGAMDDQAPAEPESARSVTVTVAVTGPVTDAITTQEQQPLSPDGDGRVVLPAVVTPGTVLLDSRAVKRTADVIIGKLGEVMASVGMGTRERLNAEQARRAKADIVFAYWAKRLNHEDSIYDTKRENRLIARLRENGDNVHELLYALDGAMRDDNLMGRKNDSTRKYDGIETIYRDRAQVERLAGDMPGWRRQEPHPIAVKYAEVFDGLADQ